MGQNQYLKENCQTIIERGTQRLWRSFQQCSAFVFVCVNIYGWHFLSVIEWESDRSSTVVDLCAQFEFLAGTHFLAIYNHCRKNCRIVANIEELPVTWSHDLHAWIIHFIACLFAYGHINEHAHIKMFIGALNIHIVCKRYDGPKRQTHRIYSFYSTKEKKKEKGEEEKQHA